jgi:SAM-dependent methyltransferase
MNMITDDATLDVINKRAWKSPSTVRIYDRLTGWTDPGESAALDSVAAEMHMSPILDIGVGAGRTTPILQQISDDYIGIDYVSEMVTACKRKYPSTTFLQMDARDLSHFADNQFSLVNFSFNGIDSVSFADRQRIMQEVHRVLKPNGVFIVSAHNRNGPGCGEQPQPWPAFTRNPLKFGWRLLKHCVGLPLAIWNYRRFSPLNELHEDWAVANSAAHNFGIVIVYTTLAEQKRALASAGFRTELVFDNVKGQPVTEQTDVDGIWWFHYVARKVDL